jgi:hypothetical protein
VEETPSGRPGSGARIFLSITHIGASLGSLPSGWLLSPPGERLSRLQAEVLCPWEVSAKFEEEISYGRQEGSLW